MRRTLRDLLVIERILRDRDGVWRQIHEQRDLKTLIVQMLTSSVIALACYGAVLGASNGFGQAVSSAVKLPLLFLITIGICLPTLYLFNLVFGARLSVLQALSLVMLTVNVASVLSLTFAPISLFFLVTAPNYEFFKLLNVSILMLTALVGLRFLISGMRGLNKLAHPAVPAIPPVPRRPAEAPVSPAVQVEAAQPVMVGAGGPEKPDEAAWRKPVGAWPDGNGSIEPHQPPYGAPNPAYATVGSEKQSSTALLYVWIVLFGFVGTQLGWTLRPFFGSPYEKFELFRAIDGNFYVDIVKTITGLF